MATRYDIKEILTSIGDRTLKWLEKNILPREGYPQELYAACWEYTDRGGKRFRPALCYLTCEALGGNPEDTLPACAALELIHGAMLLPHDDIEDGSNWRRGGPTLHIKYGLPTAVNAGDYGGFKTLECLKRGREVWGVEKFLQIYDLWTEMLIKTGEGQALEIYYRKLSLSEATFGAYREIVKNKCGYYTGGTPMAIGAVIADRPEMVQPVKEIGITIADGFQTIDDVRNVQMKEEEVTVAPGTKEGGVGKDFAGDLEEGKRTLLAAHLFWNADLKDKMRFEKLYGKEGLTVEEKKEIIGLMKKYGSIDYAINWAREKLEIVKKMVKERIEPSEGREKLLALLHYYVERTF